MNPFAKDPRKEADSIKSEAAAWLIEEEAGFSAGHAAAFEAWCREDPRHEAAVVQLRAAYGQMLRLRNYRPGARIHPDPELLAPSSPRRARARVYGYALALAASLIIVFTVAFSDRFAGVFRDDGIRYTTDAGGYNRVSLADGSVMAMNANSDVRVRISGKQRYILMMKGESHFTVAHDPARPFVVEAGGLQVKAIGTEFNVRTSNHAVEVLVTQGRVQLAAATPEGLRRTDTPILKAGQRAAFADLAELAKDQALPVAIEEVSVEDVRAALAWQSPQLHFVNATLADVVRQFNQRSHIQIVLADPELNNIPVGGSFRPENVEGFVRLLASANEVVVEQPEPNRFVLRRATRQ
ncbi:MAG: FecR domain-containing protein [Verrucomicrobiota bacterium]